MNERSNPLPYRHTLIVMRHAKSDWGEDLPDVARPLSERGERDAAAAGHWLDAAPLDPNLAVVSPAVRTQQTWHLVAAAMPWAPTAVTDQRIYAADPDMLLQVVRELPEDLHTVVLVGHNPGCEVLVGDLASPDGDAAAFARMASKYRTLGTAVLGIPASWADIGHHNCDLLDFVVPRG
ncbi:MAG: histidine phosphatase family protein [Actinomycetia bacterium]|nr:histidine phosphatase family protein [Actinomycetes bacterium]